MSTLCKSVSEHSGIFLKYLSPVHATEVDLILLG